MLHGMLFIDICFSMLFVHGINVFTLFACMGSFCSAISFCWPRPLCSYFLKFCVIEALCFAQCVFGRFMQVFCSSRA